MKLFVGIPVSEEIKKLIQPVYGFLKQTGGNFSFVPLENIHFTLKFLGDIRNVQEVIKELQEVSFNSFKVSLKGINYFGTNLRVILVGAESRELDKLASVIREKLASFQDKNKQPNHNNKQYSSHLTIARVKSARNINIVKTIIKKHANSEFGKILVDRFVLYSSDLSGCKPVYSIIKEFKLNSS